MCRWARALVRWPVERTVHVVSLAPEIELLRSQQAWINRRLLELDAALEQRRAEREQ